MNSIQQAPTLDVCNAKIVRDGNRFILEPYTSDCEALLEQMAENRTLVCVTTSSPEATY